MGHGAILLSDARKPALDLGKSGQVALRRKSDMSKISRRTFVHTAAASIGTFGILTDRAKGAEFSYKFANNQPVTHPMNVRAKEATAKILEESGGRLEVTVFPNNQLGADTDMLQQLRRG